MRRGVRAAWIGFGLVLAQLSGAETPPPHREPPAHRGVFVQDASGSFYEVVKSPDAGSKVPFSIKPVSLSSKVAMPSGMSVYPLVLTRNQDGIPEFDPVSGEFFGPAGLISEWNRSTREFRARYSNGAYSREFLKRTAPDFLPSIEDALTDRSGNVFWISETIGKGLRIHHENAFHPEIPLNEIIIGEQILKVRGNPSGDGVLLLLESGQVLDLVVPVDFSLRVTRVNALSRFKVVDFEVGPVAGNPHEFSLVLFGTETVRGKTGLWIREAGASGSPLQVRMGYTDAFRREIDVLFIRGLFGNSHFTGLSALIDRPPADLNRFLQFQYEIREAEIRLLMHSNGKEPALIRRKVKADPRKGGLCRYYLLSNFGLSPDLFLN